MLSTPFRNLFKKIKSEKRTLIVGRKVRLRLVQRIDLERLRCWRNENLTYFFNSAYISKESQQRWFKGYQKKEDDLIFIIETLAGKPIGTVSLYRINPAAKEAEFGRMVIGDRKSRRKGFGRDAAESLIRFAFLTLKLRQLKLEVFKNNQPAISLYEKIGFQKIRISNDRAVMVLTQKEFV